MDGRRAVLPLNWRGVRPLKLTIASSGGLIEPPAWDDSDPAVRAQRNLDGSIWAYSYAEGSERWMHVPGIASFRFGSCGEEAIVVPEPGAPPAAKFPDLERATLSNGLKIVLAERPSVPQVRFDLLLDAGFAADQSAEP